MRATSINGAGLLDVHSSFLCERLLGRRQRLSEDKAGCPYDALGTAASICELWWTGNDPRVRSWVSLGTRVNDPQAAHYVPDFYFMMLSARVFAEYHDAVAFGLRYGPSNKTMQDQISVIVVQMLAKLLSSQNDDGSWGQLDTAKTTAYALLSLLAIIDMPQLLALYVEAQCAIQRGRQALRLMHNLKRPTCPDWTRENELESRVMLEAYSVAAMQKPPFEHPKDEKARMIAENQTQEVLFLSRYFSSLPHMKKESFSMIKAAILEGGFYIPLLKKNRNEIFPAMGSKEKDKYFNYIPPLWLFASTVGKIFLPPEMLLDMMTRSLFIFLIDEYMASKVKDFSRCELQKLKEFIETMQPESNALGADFRPQSLVQNGCASDSFMNAEGALLDGVRFPTNHDESDRLKASISVLGNFANRVLNWPTARNAAPSDLLELRSETKKYILYHIAQIEDNIRFAAQSSHGPHRNIKFITPRAPYHVWAHTVGAGHVSGPFQFAFALCCISSGVRGGKDCFTGVKQKLNAYDMNSHIGAYCCLYNDYSTIARDREERNLNSINFPEFFIDDQSAETDTDHEIRAKAMLREAAEYKRKCAVEMARPLLKELDAEGCEGIMVANCLRVCIGCCEHFSDMHLYMNATNSYR